MVLPDHLSWFDGVASSWVINRITLIRIASHPSLCIFFSDAIIDHFNVPCIIICEVIKTPRWANRCDVWTPSKVNDVTKTRFGVNGGVEGKWNATGERWRTLNCLFFILLFFFFLFWEQNFSTADKCPSGVYKAGSLILWGPLLYFVFFCNWLTMLKAYCFSLFRFSLFFFFKRQQAIPMQSTQLLRVSSPRVDPETVSGAKDS